MGRSQVLASSLSFAVRLKGLLRIPGHEHFRCQTPLAFQVSHPSPHLPQERRDELHELRPGDHLLVEDDQAAQEVLVSLSTAQCLANLR